MPAREIPISLVPGERVKLTLEKTSGSVAQREQRKDVGYMPCPTGAEGLMSAQNASTVSAAPSRSLRETVPREW